LNRSPRLNLPGDGEGVTCAAAVASFLVPRLAFGEPAGEAAGEADATPVGEGVAWAFLATRCLAGDSAGLGDCACEIQIPANPTRAMRAEIFVIISASARRRRDQSQSNFGDTWSGRGPESNFSTGLERAGRLRYPLPGGPDSGMPEVGCGGFRRRFRPDETVRSQSNSRRHSQAGIQNTADQARHIRVIDIRSCVFRVSLVARTEIGLIRFRQVYGGQRFA